MRASPAADHLANFSAGHGSRLEEIAEFASLENASLQAAASAEAAREAERDAIWTEGFAAGQKETADLWRQDTERQIEFLSEARQDWVEHESAVLEQRIESGLCAIEDRIADSVSAILLGFLESAQRRWMVEKFSDQLRTLIFANRSAHISLEGPEDLMSAIVRRQASGKATFDATPRGTIDLAASIESTVIETRLASWIAGLELALECD